MPDSDRKRLAKAYIARVVTSGREQIIQELLIGMADISVALDEIISEGDYVVALWHSVGTQTRELWGVPATGREVKTRHFTRFTIHNGTLGSAATLTDRMSILAQLRSVGSFAPDFGLAPRTSAVAAGAQ
jgi:predicted ester cyclase